jgi:hypothetical protein
VEVLNGSSDVLAIAIPVSKPAWLVTNGKSRFVEQGLTMKSVLERGTSAKRGTGAEELCVVTVLIGAKLPTMVDVPRPGSGGFAPVLAAKDIATGISMVSTDVGSEVMTSYTATPAPLVMLTGATAVAPVPLVAVTAEKAPPPLASVLTRRTRLVAAVAPASYRAANGMIPAGTFWKRTIRRVPKSARPALFRPFAEVNDGL